MSLNKILETEILKSVENGIQNKTDFIAVEQPLEIRLAHYINDLKTLVITMCSPDDIEDLIYGFLFTENIINCANDIIEISTFDNELGLIAEVILDHTIDFEKFLNKRQGMVHASCGVCGKTEFDELLTFKYPKILKSDNKISSEIIQSLPGKLNQHQQAFTKTGGIHASALFDLNGELIIVREDIGRHNALDKLIGAALQLDLLPLSENIVLLSGRISFELVHKSLMAGVTVLAAIGAPSSLSVEVAKVNNLQLIGFTKPESYNIYGK